MSIRHAHVDCRSLATSRLPMARRGSTIAIAPSSAARGAALALFATLAALGTGCSGAASTVDIPGDELAVGARGDTLIGGREARADELRATVQVNGHCTASKVGPRHFLLAAHCVHDSSSNSVSPSYAPGARFTVSDARVPSDRPARELTVASTQISPGWLAACTSPCGTNILSPSHPADVAVIVASEDTPDIVAARVDARTVRPDERVVLTGYGCEEGLSREFGAPMPRLKMQAQSAVGVEALLHSGAFVGSSDADDVATKYVITRGRASDTSAASLCFGDSGGPVYRDGSGELLVVGVNAYYSFSELERSVSQTNWHTRLDADAPNGVLTWLEQLGVAVKRVDTRELLPTRVRVEAEDFAEGGEGLGYHDVDAVNQGGAYRTEGVDIEAATDDGGGFNVGWAAPGEWLAYTVNAPVGGAYELRLRVASRDGGKPLHVEIDGRDVTGKLTAPRTGGWQTYETLVAGSVTLAPGAHAVRVVFDGDGVNLNWFELAATSRPEAPATAVRVQAEDYAQGGAEVGFHDLEPENQGGGYRNDGVDLETTSDEGGGFNVGWTAAGEWLAYRVSASAAATYDVRLRVASPDGGKPMRVQIDGRDAPLTVTVPRTGGWQVYETVVAGSLTLPAGEHAVRVTFDSGGVNLNWVELTPR